VKTIFAIAMICIIPVVGFSQPITVDAPGEHRIAPVRPDVSLSDALAIAGQYIKEHNVDLSGQYIHYARLFYDDGSEGKKGLYWHIQWARGTPRLGGEYGLRVYMDRHVIPRVAGP